MIYRAQDIHEKRVHKDDQQLYRHLRISNDLLWREIMDTSSLGRTQIQQRLAEIDPTFKPHRTIWAPYISATNQRKRDRYAHEYRNHRSEWRANVLAVDKFWGTAIPFELYVDRSEIWSSFVVLQASSSSRSCLIGALQQQLGAILVLNTSEPIWIECKSH